MTKGDVIRWHAAIAAAGGMLSGAIARNALTVRLVQDALSLVKPVVREFEVEVMKAEAQKKIEQEALAKQKPQRQKRMR
jgi:hypothetical protein